MDKKLKLTVIIVSVIALTLVATSLILIFCLGNQKSQLSASCPTQKSAEKPVALSDTDNTASLSENSKKVQRINDYLKIAYGYDGIGTDHFYSEPVFSRGEATLTNYQVSFTTKKEIEKDKYLGIGNDNCTYDNNYVTIKSKDGKQIDEFSYSSDLAESSDRDNNNSCPGVPDSTDLSVIGETADAIYFYETDCFEGCGHSILKYDVKNKKSENFSLEDIRNTFNKNSGNSEIYQNPGINFIDYSRNEIYSIAGESGKNQIQILNFSKEKIVTIKTDWKFESISTSTLTDENQITDTNYLSLLKSVAFFYDNTTDRVYVSLLSDNDQNKIYLIEEENGAYKLNDVAADINIKNLSNNDFVRE